MDHRANSRIVREGGAPGRPRHWGVAAVPCRSALRPGFTLVELMIVVAIIAVLATITLVAIGNIGEKAREAATEATIRKLHSMLQQRLEAFDRSITDRRSRNARDYRDAEQTIRQAVLQLLGAQGSYVAQDKTLMEIIIRKFRIRAMFPQTYAELQANHPALFSKLQGQANGQINAQTTQARQAESAEVLFAMLTQADIPGAPTVDRGEFLASETADTDGDGLPELVDGWGRPLRFYRWPTRLIQPEFHPSQGHGHQHHGHAAAKLLIAALPGEDVLHIDPDDPRGRLAPIIKVLTPEGFERQFHTPATYHAFLVVSAGADGVLGLGEPTAADPNGATDVERFGYLAVPDPPDLSNLDVLTDNITNRNRRTGQ